MLICHLSVNSHWCEVLLEFLTSTVAFDYSNYLVSSANLEVSLSYPQPGTSGPGQSQVAVIILTAKKAAARFSSSSLFGSQLFHRFLCGPR